jgi:hypothetical protein
VRQSDRTQRGVRTPTGARDERSTTGAASGSAVLRLQATAGNTAVTGLFAVRQLQRKRSLPKDATSLADYGGVRGEITLDTDQATLLSLKDTFKHGSRFATRAGFDLSFHYSPDIAGSKDSESVIETGLANVAIGMFNLTEGTKAPARIGLTHLQNLDLKQFGGRDGRYRFTSVAGAAGKDTEILVEFLGASPPGLASWDALGKDRQGSLSGRFERFKFTWGDGDVAWANDKKAQVMQALGLIPDAILTEVSGITWERGKARTGPDGEAGYYGASRRTITLYTDAFGGDDWYLVKTVIHELGHGVGFRPTEREHHAKSRHDDDGFRKAAGPLKSAPTKYGSSAFQEDYAESFALYMEEKDTLRLLRPDLVAYFDKLIAGLSKPVAP